MSIWWARKRQSAGRPQARAADMSLDQLLARFTSGSYGAVDVSTPESALQAVAVWSAVDLIASLGSELPVAVYRGEGPDMQRLSTPWWLEDPGGDGQGREDWCYQVLLSWLLRGNVYGEELERAVSGYLKQVQVFHPDRVSPSLQEGDVVWLHDGRNVPANRLLHKRVNPMPGVLLGMSPIQLHASTIGVQLTAGKFGLQWFQDGGHPSALLTNTEVSLDDDQARAVKNRFMAAVRGSREPVVFGKGWEYKPIQITPEESQFLQTQGYSAAECARIFGPGIAEILGYESGGSMTYANVQDRDLTLLKYATNKWLRRLERLLSQFLPRPQYVKLNRDALLETNTVARYQAYASALSNQWRVVNEVRAKENLPPVPWGDAPAMAQAPASDQAPPEAAGDEE